MQAVGAGLGGAGGTWVSVGGFGTARGAVGVVRLGFGRGFVDADALALGLAFGAAPIDSTATGVAVSSSVPGVPLGSAVSSGACSGSATGAGNSPAGASTLAHPPPVSSSTPATTAMHHRVTLRPMWTPFGSNESAAQ
ncbi:hypothetical protein Xph01_18830 [Micromonospora phaseoli]|nr:hypothetical protein Xph01_18830 [Micromonospora phaseoli]